MFYAGAIGMEFFFFFFNDTATTEIYTLSLHDALPICDAAELAGGIVSVSQPETVVIGISREAVEAVAMDAGVIERRLGVARCQARDAVACRVSRLQGNARGVGLSGWTRGAIVVVSPLITERVGEAGHQAIGVVLVRALVALLIGQGENLAGGIARGVDGEGSRSEER